MVDGRRRSRVRYEGGEVRGRCVLMGETIRMEIVGEKSMRGFLKLMACSLRKNIYF